MDSRKCQQLAGLQKQAQDLLDRVTLLGYRWEQPASILSTMVRLMGWRLEFPILAPNRWAECDRVAKVIRITRDLPQRIEHPGQARAVAHSCLAQEIGHALLHPRRGNSRRVPQRWDYEAHVFASLLLCPWSELCGRPEVQALSSNSLSMRKRWARVQDLANHFQVTPSFMVAALVLHGLLERTPGGGIQAPYQTLSRPARPWQVA